MNILVPTIESYQILTFYCLAIILNKVQVA